MVKEPNGDTVLHSDQRRFPVVRFPVFKFFLWLLGALMLMALFAALALTGVLGGNAAFLIGWVAVGLYALVLFYGIEGEPENIGGTSLFIIILGLLSLFFILGLAASYYFHVKTHPGYTKLVRTRTALWLFQRIR